jgi:hypothetical protein
MRVLTMDSLFSWLARRFSMEAGLPIGAEVAEASRESELHREAWSRLLQDRGCRDLLRSAAILLEGELSHIRNFLRGLHRMYRSTLDSSYGGDVSAWRDDLVLRDEDPYPRGIPGSGRSQDPRAYQISLKTWQCVGSGRIYNQDPVGPCRISAHRDRGDTSFHTRAAARRSAPG